MAFIRNIDSGIVTSATSASSHEIVDHHDDGADEHQRLREHLGQRLLQALRDVVDVVRHAAQQVAARRAGRRSSSGRRLSLSSTSARRRYIVRWTTPARMYDMRVLQHPRAGEQRDGDAEQAAEVRPKSIAWCVNTPRTMTSVALPRIFGSTHAHADGARPPSRIAMASIDALAPAGGGRGAASCSRSPSASPAGMPERPAARARLAARRRSLSTSSAGLLRWAALMPAPPARSATRRSPRTSGTSRAVARACRGRRPRRLRARGSGRRR